MRECFCFGCEAVNASGEAVGIENFTGDFAARVFPRRSRGKQMSAPPPNIARSLKNPASYAGYQKAYPTSMARF